jgi:diketogulonate reductase-like aldo/keto reductase
MLVYSCVGKNADIFFVSHRSIIHVHGIYTVRNSKLWVELCSALQFDYVDLYLVHFPAHFKKDGLVKEIESRAVPPTEEEVFQLKMSILVKPRSGDLIAFHKEKWEGMERCVELGLAKAIGVSNFSVERIEEMLPYAKIIPAVNQVCFFPSSSRVHLGKHAKRCLPQRHSPQEVLHPNMFPLETCHVIYVSGGYILREYTSWVPSTAFFLDLWHNSWRWDGTIVLNVGGRAWKMQVEMHPLWQQAKLRAYCKEKGILLSAYSPLGAVGYVHGTNDVITNPTIGEIAVKYGKTPAQVRFFPNLSKLEDILAKMNIKCRSYVHHMNTVYIYYINCSLSCKLSRSHPNLVTFSSSNFIHKVSLQAANVNCLVDGKFNLCHPKVEFTTENLFVAMCNRSLLVPYKVTTPKCDTCFSLGT